MNNQSKNLLENTEIFLKKVRNRDENAIRLLYSEFRTSFIQWATEYYHISEEDAVDAFQDSVIVFYSNVASGKLKTLEASVKTYLYAIGKRKIYKQKKKNIRESFIDDLPEGTINSMDLIVYHAIEMKKEESIFLQLFKKMEDVCNEILTLFYYRIMISPLYNWL